MELVYFMRPVGHMARTPDRERRMTDELRYSLRSVAQNMPDLTGVHLFGGQPRWINTETVQCHPVPQSGLKHQNTWKLWQAIASAANADELPPEFLLMNDDFFLMRPMHAPTVLPMHCGSAADWAVARDFAGASTTAQVMRDTIRTVAELGGQSDPMAYELHVPLPVRTGTFMEIIEALGPTVARLGRVAKRTAYANLESDDYRSSAVSCSVDVKVREGVDPVPDTMWLSTSDEAFGYSRCDRVGGVIRGAFRSPCRFEVDGL